MGAPRRDMRSLIAVLGDQKERRCLRCEKQFRSTGPGNRICPHCTGSTAGALNNNSIPSESHRTRRMSGLGDQ